MYSNAFAWASGVAGISLASGLLAASQKAMAGYSVSTEPSSRVRVGTLDFGLMAVKSGLNCSPSMSLRGEAS